MLYCVRENQNPHAYHSFYLSSFSFSPINDFINNCSAPMRTKVFKFTYKSILCKSKNTKLKFILSSICMSFLLFISHSNVMYREICVKNFTGTTSTGIFKFRTNIEYDLLYCAEMNICMPIIPFICHFFFSPVKVFVTYYSAPAKTRPFTFCTHL